MRVEPEQRTSRDRRFGSRLCWWAIVWLVLLIGAVLGGGLGCGGAGSSSVCPSGWSYDPSSGCQEPDEYVVELRASMGRGAYGFAFEVTGNCAPGAQGCAAGDCVASLVGDLEVTAYRAANVVDAFSGACLREYEFVDGAMAMGSANTDDEGKYVLPLAEGSYAFTATDPIDGCRFWAGNAVIDAAHPLGRVIFGFDHGAY